MMRILLLSRYSRMGASSRLRTLQFVPWLEQAGVEVVHRPLLDDAYLERLYVSGSGWSMSVIGAYGRRIFDLLQTRRFDLVWVETEVFPWLPFGVERLLSRFRVPYVADYGDAGFHRYDTHRQSAVRHMLGDKIDQVMRHAALVMCGNDYIAERARLAGAKRVEILPTCVDLARYAMPGGGGEVPTIGWIGTPYTARYLAGVKPVIERLARQRAIRMLTVGSDFPGLQCGSRETRPWTEESEIAHLQHMDIGIMPLIDAPWERGKCGYKLIQYMACGKPVVASPVGVNRQIVAHGENGFLAENEEEWFMGLNRLLDDPNLRARMGLAGRRRVEVDYDVRVAFPLLLGWLRDVAR